MVRATNTIFEKRAEQLLAHYQEPKGNGYLKASKAVFAIAIIGGIGLLMTAQFVKISAAIKYGSLFGGSVPLALISRYLTSKGNKIEETRAYAHALSNTLDLNRSRFSRANIVEEDPRFQSPSNKQSSYHMTAEIDRRAAALGVDLLGVTRSQAFHGQAPSLDYRDEVASLKKKYLGDSNLTIEGFKEYNDKIVALQKKASEDRGPLLSCIQSNFPFCSDLEEHVARRTAQLRLVNPDYTLTSELDASNPYPFLMELEVAIYQNSRKDGDLTARFDSFEDQAKQAQLERIYHAWRNLPSAERLAKYKDLVSAVAQDLGYPKSFLYHQYLKSLPIRGFDFEALDRFAPPRDMSAYCQEIGYEGEATSLRLPLTWLRNQVASEAKMGATQRFLVNDGRSSFLGQIRGHKRGVLTYPIDIYPIPADSPDKEVRRRHYEQIKAVSEATMKYKWLIPTMNLVFPLLIPLGLFLKSQYLGAVFLGGSLLSVGGLLALQRRMGQLEEKVRILKVREARWLDPHRPVVGKKAQDVVARCKRLGIDDELAVGTAIVKPLIH